ncbi:2-oxoglutarate-dependent dioxygenase DAO [Dendrobium catenatum]|uniref:2'-deoxymugineic-acid 2'-dioxygenase n=1 Tax=Dendrobium catenatum TaxID=906689 RepID=A0A2I0VS55_9ASPA|nr:2-oxoglutarate-dependent dioxygenase DAO [Dendrobium catenatum]PKU66233.1 2'-deoxymugineic-acid 2'-dioxygenase [Dendrobium catenatum]
MATEGFVVPVINLAKFEEEKEKLISAVITYGSFRVINHGVPQKLMSDMKASTEYLFELPSEVKQCNTDVIIKSGHVVAPFYEGLGIYDASSPTDVYNFCSLLDVSSHDREILSTYASKVHDLIVDLASKIVECLGIKSYSFQEWHSHLRMNRYNFTKETIIGSIGGAVHTDNSFITILLEDEYVDGLEIMDLTGNFVPVDPVPGTFLCTMGDIAKIWSNGIFHNVRHRIICKKAMPRTTVALFMLSPKDNKIEPQAEFVDFEHPKLFQSFDYNEYRMLKLSNLSLTEKEHIDVNEAAIMALFTTQ